MKVLNDILRSKLTKIGNDQFNEGVNFRRTVKFISHLILNWDERNNILTKKYFLRKWHNKLGKLKEREDIVNNMLSTISKRQLINTSNALSDACVTTRIVRAVQLGRAAGFLVKLRNKYRDWKEKKR